MMSVLFLILISGAFHRGDEQYGMHIYPACNGSLATGSVSDVLVDTNNYDSDSFYAIRKSLAGGSYDNWDRWGSDVEYVNDNTFPITIEITNDVADNQVTVVFDSDTQHLECVYSDHFDPDADLVFALYPDPDSDSFQIDSITISSTNSELTIPTYHYIAAGRSTEEYWDDIPLFECVLDTSNQSWTVADSGNVCGQTPTGGTTDIGVSCCEVDGSGGERDTNGLQCHSPNTYHEAEQLCADAGMRLCTLDEMLSLATAQTGCGFDCRYNWVSTQCNLNATTAQPTAQTTTAQPTTAEPTTAEPTTAEPTTAEPTAGPTTTTTAGILTVNLRPFHLLSIYGLALGEVLCSCSVNEVLLTRRSCTSM